MPEKTKETQNTPKKSRLGRGIGSLISEAMSSAPESPFAPEVNEAPAAPLTQTVSAPAAATAASAPTVAAASASSVTTARPAVAAAPKAVIEAPRTVSSPAVAVEVAKPVAETPQIPENRQIIMLSIEKLTANVRQPRQIFDGTALKDLSTSIKEKGILQPIVARRLNEREFEIIAGERRWRAAQLAGLKEVPVILKQVTDQDSLELAIIENIQRENLNPMEEAEAYDLLMNEYSLTQQQVSEKLGKDRVTIANTLRLLNLPMQIKLYVRKNELTAGHAKVLLGLENQEKQLELAKQVIEGHLSVRATEKLVAREKISQRELSGQSTAPAVSKVSQGLLDSLSNELQKLVGTKVSIDYSDSKGKLNIHFYSDDQLTQIVEKLRRAWEK